jgi:Transglycosylase SLT domain
MEGSLRVALSALVVGLVLTGGLDYSSGQAAVERHTRQTASCVFDHLMLKTSPGACRPQAKKYPRRIKSKVRRAIYDSSLTFGIPYRILLQIASCESGLNPHATRPGYYGLFQFAPQTFKGGAQQLRRETGIRAKTFWNPLDSAYVAGYLFAVGKAPRWSCE